MSQSRIIYAPQDSKKIRKPFSRILSYGAVLLVLIFLGDGGIYFFSLPYWRIKHLEFAGVEGLDRKAIETNVYDILQRKTLYFFSSYNIFLASSEEIERALKKRFPKIERVNIDKQFPDILKIYVHERVLWGIFCGENSGTASCAYIDKTGFAYESSPDFQGSLLVKIKSDFPEFKIASQVIEPELLDEMFFLSREVKRIINADVIGYELFHKIPSEIRVLTGDGFKIYFNRKDDFKNAFSVLKKVMDEEIKDKRRELEYIDIRFGNKAFFKFK